MLKHLVYCTKDEECSRDLLGRTVDVVLESVQQSHFGSQFSFRHFILQIEIKIGAQMRRTVIPYLKPILNTTKLKNAN